ncbi:hypothetical protein ACC687_39025, partial [Rhizobium ruizarguesonis]
NWLDSFRISCHFAAMIPDIKICVLKTPEAVDRALKRGATHIGLGVSFTLNSLRPSSAHSHFRPRKKINQS